MAEWLNAIAIKDLKDGQMAEVTVTGRSILVARVGDKFYAANNTCPHMGGNLSQGTLEETIVTCPNHGSRFDLTDGRIVRWTTWKGLTRLFGNLISSPKPLKVYKTRVVEGQLQISI